MDNLHIGQIIDGNPPRDAIHVAVAPAVAGESLRPGQHIAIKGGIASLAPSGEGIAIVDPFLTDSIVLKDEKFWVLLYPGSITSLRHHWRHPAFADEAPEPDPIVKDTESWQWIKDYASGLGLDYDELIGAAKDYIARGEYLNKGELLVGEYVDDEFWEHYENVTGKAVRSKDRGNFFSCSC